tara:strand:+ start:13506 stop:16829 length:3324 start_codon:yes stop_codon:yes gene_type:complete
MTTIIKLKRKGVGGSDPTSSDLVHGELAINFADGKLYYKNSSNAIAQFLDSGQTVSMINRAYINDRINDDYLDSVEATNLVDSAYVNARLDRSLFLDSAEATNLVDSAYVNARLDTSLFLDSAEAHNILDSMFGNIDQHIIPITDSAFDLGDSTRRFRDLYLSGTSVTFGNIVMSEHNGAARFTNHTTGAEVKVDVSNVNTHLIDSSVILDLVDSAYVDPLVESLGYRDSAQIVNIITANYINDRINQDYLNSAETIALVDSAYVNARLDTTSFLDSAEAINLVDSAYVNARLNSALFLDSAEAVNLIDSAHVVLRSKNLENTLTLTSTDAGSTAGPELILYRNSSSPADADYLGQIQFKGRHDGPGDEIYAKVSGKIADATSGTEDGLIETAVKGNGSFTIVSRQRSDELQLLNGVGLSVDGTLTLASETVDSAWVNARLDTTSFLDSAEATALIDSGYIQARTRIGLDDIDFGSNKILYSNLYSAIGDLPSASTYHGMFAHVHGTGKGYFAHGGNWIPLVDSSNFSTRFDFDAASSSLTIDGNGSTGGVTVSDGLVAIKTGTGNVAAIDFYCEVNNAHRVKLKAPAHANFSGNPDVVLPNTSGTIALTSELFSGAYADLTGKPTLFSGAYADLTGKPALIDSGLTSSLIDSAYIQARQATGGGTFGLAGNTGTHTFNTATETLTFLGTTGQINASIAANNVSLSLDQNINSITSIAFEGDSANAHEVKLQAINPTADRTINLPNNSGTIALLSDISGGGGGVDSAATITLITNTVDSAYVQARQSGGGGGSAITVQDEGSSLSTAATILNFVGSGVTASGTGGTKTITISGGGGGGSGSNVAVDVGVDTFNGDSSTTAFTLTSEPTTDQNVIVTINGVSQHIDAYSLSGKTLTLSAAPITGDVIEARTITGTNVSVRDHKDYIYQPNPATLSFSGSDINGDVLSYDVGKLEVFYNGSRLTPGLDFAATNGTSVTLLSDFNADSNDTIVISSFSKASLIDRGVAPGSASGGAAGAQYVADTYSAASFRTSKYLVELAIDSDNKYHATELLLTHDGTTVFMSQYGHVTSDSSLGEFDADINSGNVRLLVTPSLNNTTIKTQRITIGA